LGVAGDGGRERERGVPLRLALTATPDVVPSGSLKVSDVSKGEISHVVAMQELARIVCDLYQSADGAAAANCYYYLPETSLAAYGEAVVARQTPLDDTDAKSEDRCLQNQRSLSTDALCMATFLLPGGKERMRGKQVLAS
jgi:hypothetical protein